MSPTHVNMLRNIVKGCVNSASRKMFSTVGAVVLEGYVTPDGVWAEYEAHDVDQAAADASNIALDFYLPKIESCLAKICDCQGGMA